MNFVKMPTFNREEKIMARAIDLARRGEGLVSPNPLVGAVLIYNDTIISEGWHKKFGDAHAEVNAIKGIDKEILKKSELFVTLEPCSHFGKTPPCSDLIISSQIPKVYISHGDPNPKVAGQGIQKMKNTGIKVFTNILENEGRKMNRRFLCRFEKLRPYIVLKWAESNDGFIAGVNGQALEISNQVSQTYSHKLRSFEDAIMVGTNTAVLDNPALTTRLWQGSNPIRISIDNKNRLSESLKLFNSESETLIYNKQHTFKKKNIEWIAIDNNISTLKSITGDLAKREINSIIVEGGSSLINSFIKENLWDEIHLFKSKKNIDQGIKSPEFSKKKAISLKLLNEDHYYFFKNN